MSNTIPPAPSKADSFAERLAAAKSDEKAKAQPVSGGKTEPTMRSLRRILGDDVLDIFPEGLIETVDDFYEAHQANEQLWSELSLDSADERNDLLALMRAYAECAGEKGYTVRQDRTAPPAVLKFRVTDRRGSKSDADTGDAQ